MARGTVRLMLARRRLLALAPAALLAACGAVPAPTSAPTSGGGTPGAKAGATPAPATSTPAGAATPAAGATQPAAAATRPAVTTAPAAGATRPATSQVTQVRVGYVPVLIYAPLFVAIEKGYFQAVGIESVLTPLVGGADIISQTVAGNFEAGLGGMGAAALNAARRNLDFRIVSSHHTESPPLTTPLVVPKRKLEDGTVARVADLKGKKVGINARGSATEYWLNAALTKGGLSMRDVEVVALPFDQTVAALEGGSLDASLLPEPMATLAEQRGLIARLSEDFLIDAQGTVIFYNLAWARREADLATRWLAAWLRGARDLQGDGYSQPANAAIIEQYTRVPQDVVRQARPPRHDPNGRLNLDDMRAQQAFFMETGSLTYSDPIDLTTIVDTSYAEAATRQIGST